MPAGFADGFHLISETVHVLYKATDLYAPELKRTILWNDVKLGIKLQLEAESIISAKDRDGVTYESAEKFN